MILQRTGISNSKKGTADCFPVSVSKGLVERGGLGMTIRCLAVVLVMGLLFIPGCAMRPELPFRPEQAPVQPAETAVDRELSAAQQAAAGDKAFTWAWHKLGGLYPDPDGELNSALSAMVDRLERRNGLSFPVHIAVVNHPRPAATVFPGGGIGLTRGLLQVLGDESQVAAVIAHQMGHLQAGHLQRPMARKDLLTGLRVLARMAGEGNSASGYGADVVAALAAARVLQEWEFTPEEERQADRVAVALLRGAGYPPQALAQAMRAVAAGRMEAFPPPERGKGWQYHPCSSGREREAFADVGVPTAAPPATGNLAPWRQRLIEESAGYLLYDQALQAERRNDYRTAVAGYLQAAAALPDDPLILGRLGLAYLQEGDAGNARFYLEQALRKDPDHHDSLLGLGFFHLANRDFTAARQQLEKAMALVPTLKGAYLLAEAWAGEGDLARARRLFTEVAQADPHGRFGPAAQKRLQELAGG
jgi:predicted Zn-dependent protease